MAQLFLQVQTPGGGSQQIHIPASVFHQAAQHQPQPVGRRGRVVCSSDRVGFWQVASGHNVQFIQLGEGQSFMPMGQSQEEPTVLLQQGGPFVIRGFDS